MVNLIRFKPIKPQMQYITIIICVPFDSKRQVLFHFESHCHGCIVFNGRQCKLTFETENWFCGYYNIFGWQFMKGMFVVIPALPYKSPWLITKTSSEVSIKTDFTSFWKLISSSSCGRIICWLEEMVAFLTIWDFKRASKCGEVLIFNRTSFSDVI